MCTFTICKSYFFLLMFIKKNKSMIWGHISTHIYHNIAYRKMSIFHKIYLFLFGQLVKSLVVVESDFIGLNTSSHVMRCNVNYQSFEGCIKCLTCSLTNVGIPRRTVQNTIHSSMKWTITKPFGLFTSFSATEVKPLNETRHEKLRWDFKELVQL